MPAAAEASALLQVPLYFADSVFRVILADRSDSLRAVHDSAVLRRFKPTVVDGDVAVFQLGTGYVMLVRRPQYALVQVFNARFAQLAAAEQVAEP